MRTLLSTLLLILAAQAALANEGTLWKSDLETAKHTAQQSGRLVLVHFGAPWCAPCQKLEAEVFAQPGFEAALAQRFEMVKLNVDDHPELIKLYGVNSVPTDVVLLPDGRMVDRTNSPMTAAAYVGHMNQVVARLQGPAAQVAAQPHPAMQPQPHQPMTPPQMAAPHPQQPPVGAYAQPPVAPGYQQPAMPPHAAVPAHPVAMTTPPAAPPMPQQQQLPLGLDGNCPVDLCEQHKWTPGKREFGRVYRGRTYLFGSEDALKKFEQNPDRYAPVAAGFDPVVSLDQGQTMLGKREHGVFYEDRVYLFANEQSLDRFKQNPQRYSGEALQARR